MATPTTTIDIVRVNSSRPQNTAQYEPPDLPAYLADSFELMAILGVPTDDGIKAIYAVIRAVENVSIGKN